MARRAPIRVCTVGVVTDSTSCLPEELVTAFAGRLVVVPLNVSVAGESFVEGEDIDSDDVDAAQEDGVQVSTSRPAPARLLEAYTHLAQVGCSHVVSMHASAALSSTVDSARLAAAESPVPVTVLDSRTLGMAMGFAALTGARWAAAGCAPDDVAAVMAKVAAESATAFYVDSLEPLRRGGRVGRAGALLGSALSIKPLLQVKDGAIEPLARVRTSARAMDRLASWAQHSADRLAPDEVAFAVHCLKRRDLAEKLSAAVKDRAARAPEGASTPDTSHTPDTPDSAIGHAAGSALSDGGGAGYDASGTGAEPVEATPGHRGETAPIVIAPLGAVVTAHVGGGAVAVVVAPQLHPTAPSEAIATE